MLEVGEREEATRHDHVCSLRLQAGDGSACGQRQTREVHAGSAYLSGSSLVQHFGLGGAERVDALAVRWPSGIETVLANLEANRRYILHEGDAVAVAVRTWKLPYPVPADD